MRDRCKKKPLPIARTGARSAVYGVSVRLSFALRNDYFRFSTRFFLSFAVGLQGYAHRPRLLPDRQPIRLKGERTTTAHEQQRQQHASEAHAVGRSIRVRQHPIT